MKIITMKDLFFCKPVVFFTMTILLLTNCYLGFIPALDNVIKTIGLIISAVVICVYLLNFKFNKETIALMLFWTIMSITCICGEYSSLKTMLNIFYPIVAITFYLDLGIRYECEKVLKISSLVFLTLCFINLITILLYPTGMYHDILYTTNWFFKYDNTHIFMFYPAILISYICTQYNNDNNKFYKIIFIFQIIIILSCIFICKSATSMVAFVLIMFYLLFSKKIDKISWMNPKSYLLVYIVIFVLFVILRIQNIFSWFIVDILGKDLTFSTRTYLWDSIIEYIKLKPILGYGIEDTYIFRNKLGSLFYTHAHNTILDVTYKAGVIGLLLHFITLIFPINKLNANKKSKLSKFISIIFLGLFLMMNFEARQEKIGLYIILIIAFNIEKILNSINKKEKNNE